MSNNVREEVEETLDGHYGLPEPESKEGFEFGGWYTKKGGQGTMVGADSIVTAGGATTFYARWQCTVIFTDGDIEISQRQLVDKPYIIPTGTFRDGFEFGGWFTEKGGRGEQVTVETTVTLDDTIFLYAMWSFSIDFMVGDDRFCTVEQVADRNYALPKTDPFKDGVDFGGWYTKEKGAGAHVTENTLVALTDAVVLYVNWTINVIFDDGTDQQLIGEPVDGTYILPECTRGGYAFGGWFTGKEGQGDEITSDSVFSAGDATTLHAKWAAEVYTVTFDANGGTLSDDSAALAVYDQAFAFDRSASWGRHPFLGWYTSDGQKVVSGDIWKFETDMTLYAHWVDVITVVFVVDGNETEIQEIVGSRYELPADPAKDGYGFSGWFDGNENRITSETVVTADDSKTVYAHWTDNSHSPAWYISIGLVAVLAVLVTVFAVLVAVFVVRPFKAH